MFMQANKRWIHAPSLFVMLEGKICFVSLEECLLSFPLPRSAFHSWWELWLIHVKFNEVPFLSYVELPAPYLSKFGHFSTKKGSSAIGKALETPCKLSQYELNDDTGSQSRSFKRSSTRPLPVCPLWCYSFILSLCLNNQFFSKQPSWQMASGQSFLSEVYRILTHLCLLHGQTNPFSSYFS